MKIKRFHYFGTGAGLPSLRRNVSAMAVDFESEWFLFDCGEGTQQRIMASPLKMSRLTHIFISHFHGDHLYGLPGLLSTMQLQGIYHDLTIIGPAGIKEYVEYVYRVSKSTFKRVINYVEINSVDNPMRVFESSSFSVDAALMKHRITCYGFRLKMHDLPGKFNVEKADELGIPNDSRRSELVKGNPITLDNNEVIQPEQLVSAPIENRDFTYITDTAVCDNVVNLAQNSHFLHHECTFMEGEEDLAAKSGHCTISEVIEMAEKAGVKQLQLAHFSSRYDDYQLPQEFDHLPFSVILTRDRMQIDC
ncbi:MAG: ribonuclease Z [Calditrichaeota bacterium]|nr:ribonuclease Z [Calditrichota bacterium]